MEEHFSNCARADFTNLCMQGFRGMSKHIQVKKPKHTSRKLELCTWSVSSKYSSAHTYAHVHSTNTQRQFGADMTASP
eukprot:129860-Pleurochrysis_carterae.AAC.2